MSENFLMLEVMTPVLTEIIRTIPSSYIDKSGQHYALISFFLLVLGQL